MAVIAGITVVSVMTAALGLWGALAFAIAGPADDTLRWLLAAGYGATAVAAALTVTLAGPPWRWRASGAFAMMFLGWLLWWNGNEPSNDRDWQVEVARLAYADIGDPLVTLHNVRNFHYRTEDDFDVDYYDRTYNLDDLITADLVASYWMGPHIAHIFLTFGFRDGSHVAVSIETRKEKGEEYSTLAGFFRQYELYYVVADKRDIIRVRTDIRSNPKEDVYLYRLNASPSLIRGVFLDYLNAINRLHEHPEFYNTLTTNCTTGIWMHSRINPERVPLSWKVLLSGHAPEYLYEMGRLDNSAPFPELQQRARIKRGAANDGDFGEFSRLIRQGTTSSPMNRPPPS